MYVPEGAAFEVAEPCSVRAWITNKDTGKRERRTVKMQAGWFGVRPRIVPFGKADDGER